ncbi:MAG: autotransporter domain-containing protein, partial [Methylacidiphilales bacterium]|nr:autotransporter domain-containing protein [Candidatus Methylacidiphilales bacterium]
TVDSSAGASVEMAGALSGGGGIKFLGTGTNTAFTFGSANSYTGSTVIEDGTLTANLSQIGSSTLINIFNSSSVLDYQTVGGGTDKLSSVLTGSGTFNVSFTDAGDTLELANPAANSFTGTINLAYNNSNPGTLQIFNGSFNAITDNGTGSSVTIGDDSNVATSGTVTFTTNETYTGLTTVGSGTDSFTLNALGLAGAATINANSSLYANNIAENVTNSGTLGVAGAVGSTLTIGGALTSTTGTVIFRTHGTTSDFYSVTGATDTLGSIPVISGYGSTPVGGTVVLDSTGALTASNSYTVSNLLFSATLAESSNDHELLLTTVQKGAANFAQTPNQVAVANAIDTDLIMGTLPGGIGAAFGSPTLTAGEIPVILDELSPEVLQYSRDIAFENSTFLAQQVNGVLANVRSGYARLDMSGLSVVSSGFNSGLGQSLNSLLAYNPPSFDQPAPNGVNYYPQPGGYTPSISTSSSSSSSESSPSSNSRSISDSPNPDTTVPPTTLSHSEPNFNGPVMSEFILGNVVLANMNQDQSAPNAAPDKASYTASNATAGISFRMTNNLAAGVLFNYAHTDAKTDSNGSKTEVNSYSPGVYATWFDKGFYVNGLFSYGYNTYSNTRVIPFLASTASSSPTGEQYVGNLDLGYDFQPKNHHEWVLGPTAGLTYTHLDIDSFTESGAGPADLSVNSQNLDSLRSQLGAHVVYQARAGSLLFQPNFIALWQHEYLNNPGITSQLNIPGTSPFTIQTANSGNDSALLGAGLTVTLDNSMVFYVNYLADVGSSDFWAQSIVGGFKASF